MVMVVVVVHVEQWAPCKIDDCRCCLVILVGMVVGRLAVNALLLLLLLVVVVIVK